MSTKRFPSFFRFKVFGFWIILICLCKCNQEFRCRRLIQNLPALIFVQLLPSLIVRIIVSDGTTEENEENISNRGEGEACFLLWNSWEKPSFWKTRQIGLDTVETSVDFKV